MKHLFAIMSIILIVNLSFGQVSGNINYQKSVNYSDNNIQVQLSPNTTVVNVKGLANVKADSYVAIFSVTQVGKTTTEVNGLIDTRIQQALGKIKAKPNVKTFVDMISFVPVYEFNVEKKIFSKKTYNEIPTGFEVKKNIHIAYKDANLLNEIISTLSNNEIYDLVRVDYFSSALESIKKELRIKSQSILQEKLTNYQSILGKNLDSLDKSIADGFKIVLPVERYNSYQSYSSSSLNFKKNSNIENAKKSTTSYYQPVMDKEFDFVMNPIVLEPVIQVMYEIKLEIQNINEKKNDTEYMLVTPNGDIKSIRLN